MLGIAERWGTAHSLYNKLGAFAINDC
jgi:hypothetical protein